MGAKVVRRGAKTIKKKKIPRILKKNETRKLLRSRIRQAKEPSVRRVVAA